MFLSEEPCLDISAITFASQVIYISGLQMGHSFAGPARSGPKFHMTHKSLKKIFEKTNKASPESMSFIFQVCD